ncbi:hypothetical protein D7V97_24290 [Corallococcus sp. CA053C]|uniref:hypothetical protein n=1 Tax=Corallococcus sp. CA053C TaxID=2316732 RepID=UPI000EA17A5E|nr:hypothetical protein [Corallococcus sp. CA053C]RKH05239.1 hypothetical protein D7V97_24290 [Corallococcus sp. CA053C]
MSPPSLSRLVLVLALVWGGAVLAQPPRRQPQDFQSRKELTQEEKDAAKARAMGNNLNGYGKDVQIKETPIPWMAIGLVGIVFLVATPFAIRAYRGTVKEMSSSNTFGIHERPGEDEA